MTTSRGIHPSGDSTPPRPRAWQVQPPSGASPSCRRRSCARAGRSHTRRDPCLRTTVSSRRDPRSGTRRRAERLRSMPCESTRTHVRGRPDESRARSWRTSRQMCLRVSRESMTNCQTTTPGSSRDPTPTSPWTRRRARSGGVPRFSAPVPRFWCARRQTPPRRR